MEIPGRYNNAYPYVVTALWEGKRRVRFLPQSLEAATFWLRWLQRNEPETEPAIQYVGDAEAIGEGPTPEQLQAQINTHISTAIILSSRLQENLHEEIEQAKAIVSRLQKALDA